MVFTIYEYFLEVLRGLKLFRFLKFEFCIRPMIAQSWSRANKILWLEPVPLLEWNAAEWTASLNLGRWAVISCTQVRDSKPQSLNLQFKKHSSLLYVIPYWGIMATRQEIEPVRVDSNSSHRIIMGDHLMNHKSTRNIFIYTGLFE